MINNFKKLFEKKDWHKRSRLYKFFIQDDTKLKIECKTSAHINKYGKVVTHREFYTLRALVNFSWWYVTKQPYEKTKELLENLKYSPQYQLRFVYTFVIVLLGLLGDLKNISNLALVGGAIAVDAVTSSGSFADTTLTFAHTCTGSNLVLVVSVGSGSRDIATCKYNNVNCTAGVNYFYDSSQSSDVWYLGNPATGSHNVVATTSSSTLAACAISFSGANSSSPIGATAQKGQKTSASSISQAITTTYDNSYLVDCFTLSPRYTGTVWATDYGTQRHYLQTSDDNGATGCATIQVVTAGAQTMGWSYVSGETAYRNSIGILEIRELAVVGPANLKTYNTNAKANIKTINTNAIANVKTLNTNA